MATTLIGLMLAGAGAGTSIVASEGAKDAMNKKTNDELLRQKEYQKRATKAFDTSLSQSTPSAARGQVDSGIQKAQDEYAKVQGVPLTASSASPLNGNVATIQGQSDSSYNRMLAKSGAVGQGYSNFSLQQYLKDLVANQGINIPASQAERSSSILPYELDTASHSQDTLNSIGTGLSALSSLVGLFKGKGNDGSTAKRAIPLNLNNLPMANFSMSQGNTPWLNATQLWK